MNEYNNDTHPTIEACVAAAPQWLATVGKLASSKSDGGWRYLPSYGIHMYYVGAAGHTGRVKNRADQGKLGPILCWS